MKTYKSKISNWTRAYLNFKILLLLAAFDDELVTFVCKKRKVLFRN
jgi:hypothetical protein